jgi:hypothetical protein
VNGPSTRAVTLTTMDHHIQDFERKIDFDDTHWAEFEQISMRHYNHVWLSEAKRSDGSYDFDWIVAHGHIHYHVWRQHEMVQILAHARFQTLTVLDKLYKRPDSFLIITQTPPDA